MLVMLVLLLPACYSHTPIKPTEAPKLNGSFETQVEGAPNVYAIRVTDVETPSGTLEQIEGEFDLMVKTRSGKSYVFEHPVRSAVHEDALLLKGKNLAATRIELSDITSIEVITYNKVASGVVAGGLAAFAAGLVLVYLTSD